MSKEEIDLGTLLHKLRQQTRDKMVNMKNDYPLLMDYLDLELNELERQYENVHKKSPVTPEDEALLYFNYRRVDGNLSKIEHGGFPYLWDDHLYSLMKKAHDSDLGVTSDWVKVLIASNLLELSLNQALINKNRELFDKLRKDNASIFRKVDEVNKILEKENQTKLKRSDIKFINSHRVDADHPVSEFIKELDDGDSIQLIEAVKDCLDCLQPLLQTQESNGKYDEEDYLSGKYHTGNASKKTRELYFKIKNMILENFEDLQARQTKAYVGFYLKDTKILVCTLDVARSKIKLSYAIGTSKNVISPSDFIRHVKGIGIFGSGDYQSEIKNETDIEKTLPDIKKVYDFKIEN